MLWILIIDSSDIVLKSDDNWVYLFRKSVLRDFATLRKVPQMEDTNIPLRDKMNYAAGEFFYPPARALGTIYSSAIEEYFSDLAFPRLNRLIEKAKTQSQFWEEKIELLVLLKETKPQEIRFNGDPYWYDTCTLKELLAKYFAENLPEAKLTFAKASYVYGDITSTMSGVMSGVTESIPKHDRVVLTPCWDPMISCAAMNAVHTLERENVHQKSYLLNVNKTFDEDEYVCKTGEAVLTRI